MDIQEWMNTVVVQSGIGEHPSPRESDFANSAPLRPKQKKYTTNSTYRCKGRFIPLDASRADKLHEVKAAVPVKDQDFIRSTDKDQSTGRNVFTKDVNSDSSADYKRKPRRKTRPERYDLKTLNNCRSKTITRSKQAVKKTRKKDGCKKKFKENNRAVPLGNAHLRSTGLCPSRPRLSLPSKERFGSQCKPQPAQMRPGQHADKQKCFCNSGQQKNEDKRWNREQAIQEEISIFFKDRRAPLAEKNINTVQNGNFTGKRKRANSSETNIQDPVRVDRKASAEEEHFSFARLKDRPRSSNYFSWSSSPQRSSPPTRPLQSKAREVNVIQEHLGCHACIKHEEQAPKPLPPRRLPNNVSNENHCIQQCWGVRSLSNEGMSSLRLSVNSFVDPQKLVQRAGFSTNAETKSEWRQDDTQLATDGLSRTEPTKANIGQATENNTKSGRSASWSQGADDLQRSSSSLGRLLHECEYALAHGTCEEKLAFCNTATRQQQVQPEHAYEYPLCHEYGAVPPRVRNREDWRNQSHVPYIHGETVTPASKLPTEIGYSDDEKNILSIHDGNERNILSNERLSNHKVSNQITDDILPGFWRPQKLY